MRLSTTFICSALAACVLPAVGAIQYTRSGSLTKRASHNVSPARAPVILQRQHHVQRNLLDLCISIDAGVLAPILHIIDPLAAKVHLCLCLHDLNLFLDTDIGILLANLLGGKNNLLAAIKLLINTSPQSQQCNFPPHSHHACVQGHPCAFECDPPYVQHGTTCVCPPPLMECNGKCGSFPNGCGSAVPHYKQKRASGPIATFAQAQAFCKSEAVCGIAGREEETDFECIDTSVTLDSCGGCVTPHRFTDILAPSATGIECGRLPGVITAACSNSRCVITQCREGWHLNANRNECVYIAGDPVNRGHSSRMRKRGILASADVVIDPDLAAKINAYVVLVIDLVSTSGSIPVPPTAPHTPTSHPPINHADLVGAVVAATVNLLKSHTVAEIVANVNALVHVNNIVAQTFGGCGCSGTLGLGQLIHQLVRVIDCALDMQHWCGSHPVGIPAPHPFAPTTTLPYIPNTSDVPITVGLDDVLNALGLASKGSRIDVFGLGSGLTSIANNLLNGLGLGRANVRSRSVHPPTVNAAVVLDLELLAKLNSLVDLVIALVNNVPMTLPAAPNSPPIIGTDPLPPSEPSLPVSLPIDSSLVDCIVQAVVNLGSSPTVAALVRNINALVNVNAIVAKALGTCGCVDAFDLGGLVGNLDAVINVALDIQDWCIHNPVGVPIPYPTGPPLPYPTGTPVPSPSVSLIPHPSPVPSGTPSTPALPNESNEAVIVGLDQLLTGLLGTLGLGPIKVDVVVDNLVGAGLAHSLNNVLNGLGIGPANVIPRGGALSVDANVIAQVDQTLVAQIRALVNLVLIVKNGSSSLPTAPHSSSPIIPGHLPSGYLPIDTKLVDGIVRAAINLLNSNTVSALLLNVDVLAQVGALVSGSLAGCECREHLGLRGLAMDIENLLAAVSSVQSWCAHHPVIPSPVPTTSLPSPQPLSTPSVSVPAPTPGSSSGTPAIDLHVPISLNLGDLLSSLGVNLTSDVDAVVDLNNLVEALVNIVINLQGHSSPLPPAITVPAPHPSASTSVPVPPYLSASQPAAQPSGTPSAPPITQGLVVAIVHAAAGLLHSLTGADVLANVNILLSASGVLADALDGCGCVGPLGLQPLVQNVDELLNTLLAIHVWCQNHPGVVGGGGDAGIGTGTGPSGSVPSSSIILNAEQLLGALGLGNVAHVDGAVTGLGSGVNGLINPILNAVGLGGLRRWLTGR
ncbi:hypothetical protein D9615_005453 [Tricholomella constricta]|uniref:Protein CPL1-like domain-containing protein n=1 Tax=Tricholomella constricta TaxID=117010 RepID=A0A8H5M5Q9_9AGAR|nr:hypothetical protein D9615_005453 [Tricholomella constricta]